MGYDGLALTLQIGNTELRKLIHPEHDCDANSNSQPSAAMVPLSAVEVVPFTRHEHYHAEQEHGINTDNKDQGEMPRL